MVIGKHYCLFENFARNTFIKNFQQHTLQFTKQSHKTDIKFVLAQQVNFQSHFSNLNQFTCHLSGRFPSPGQPYPFPQGRPIQWASLFHLQAQVKPFERRLFAYLQKSKGLQEQHMLLQF
eukprot:TRINITY_DN818_c0_g1_i7.p3 TRINITY_DN818_c0_g1~~TRINITY_DN818_c0_g1_i7.p3  ORF type:complete len:120 (+),score=0.41 TRINITY_DN818_c0_g1_i7:620-979(+)